MKKAILIIIFGLLLSSNAFAKEFKVYHKDENNISIERGWTRSKQYAMAAKHCGQYKKFAFYFQGGYNQGAQDEKGETTYLFHCTKSNLSKSPISGKKIHWTNYDPNHEFAQQQKEDKKFAKIEQYKTTCAALGFELGTDKFADCTLKLFVADNKETTKIVQSSSGAQEIIIRDPDRERRIGIKAFSDLVNGKCQVNLLSKNPCQF